MTAYRQRALACAAALSHAPARPRDLKPHIPEAPKILLSNVYGWFLRLERGLYALTDEGRAALARWPAAMAPPRPSGDGWSGDHEALAMVPTNSTSSIAESRGGCADA